MEVASTMGINQYFIPAAVRADLETPAVLVDRRIMQANMTWMQDLAVKTGLKLRPHVKTHKSVAIARQQMATGACGLTAAKVEEALVFIEAGLPSLTLAYPQVTATKLDRLLAAAKRRGCDLRLMVDSAEGLALLDARATELRCFPGVFVKIDVGLHRCGCPPDDPLVFTLVEKIVRAHHLDWRGLLSHAGQAYGAVDGPAAARMAEEERQCLTGLAARLRQAGFKIPEISVGSTPTVLAAQSFEGLTEIRPGNYVFMDETPLRLGLITPSQIALSVLTTVVSTGRRYAIVDAGAKTLSSDRGAHGTAGITGYGRAYHADQPAAGDAPLVVAKLSEEHGFVESRDRDLKPGDQLRIYPNHACSVVNLAREVFFLEENVLAVATVDAAGCVR
jgi:D-serine deaminase-like pyridoxal phosphate-dependent protein